MTSTIRKSMGFFLENSNENFSLIKFSKKMANFCIFFSITFCFKLSNFSRMLSKIYRNMWKKIKISNISENTKKS